MLLSRLVEMSTMIKIPGVHRIPNTRMKNSTPSKLRKFSFVHLEFISNQCGILKLLEIVLGSCCQVLLFKFSISSSQEISESLLNFNSTVSSCLLTTLLLYLSYVFSQKTYKLLRSSVFVRLNLN